MLHGTTGEGLRRVRRFFSIAALTLVTAALAKAQESAPARELAPAPPRSFEPTPPREFRLENGLRFVVQRDTRQPIFAFLVSYEVGSRDDPPGYEGLAHLVEHLAFRGSRHLGPHQGDRELQKVGALRKNGMTMLGNTVYFAVLPAQYLPLAFWVESERMGFTLERFNGESLALEAATVRKELLQRHRRDEVELALLGRLFPEGSPYRVTEQPDARAATLSDVKWFFQAGYRPDRVAGGPGLSPPLRGVRISGRYCTGCAGVTFWSHSVGVEVAASRSSMPDPARNPDLHGNVPDTSSVALVIVDVLNALDFEGSEAFVPRAVAVGEKIGALKARVANCGIPAIYVNDNVGRWRSDVQGLVAACTHDDAPGAPLAKLLVPSANDYVVLKPKHSGFYATTLDTLLTYLRATRLILTGLTTERCLLFTANDAFLRDYELFVPSDCSAAIDEADHAAALRILERVLDADTTPSSELDVERLRAGAV